MLVSAIGIVCVAGGLFAFVCYAFDCEDNRG